MKIVTAIVAALVGVTGLTAVAAPAAAQDRVVVRERTVTPAVRHDRVVVRQHTSVHRGYGYRRAPRRVCTVRYHHGRKIRACRTVYRR